jgi:hypothetical protein
LRRSVGERLATLIEDAFVPGWGLNGIRGAGEIFPQRLHCGELLVETHIFQGKVERHGGSIPQGWMDSNPKLLAIVLQAQRRIARTTSDLIGAGYVGMEMEVNDSI